MLHKKIYFYLTQGCEPNNRILLLGINEIAMNKCTQMIPIVILRL